MENTTLFLRTTRIAVIGWIFVGIIVHNVNSNEDAQEGPPARYFEPVRYRYTDERLHKRSVDMKVGFESYGRTFVLDLIPDQTVFHGQIDTQNSDGNYAMTSTPVIGFVEGDNNSRVHGILSQDRTFEGVIYTGEDQYYVEPSTRHWTEPYRHGQSIMYSSNSIIRPPSSLSTPCQSHLLNLQRSDNDTLPLNNQIKSRRRNRRWVIDHRKKTCMLYLQADYAFYSRFGSEESAITVMTSHIQHLNEIYRQTDFNSDGLPDDIQFMIKRIKVHTKNSTMDPTYPYDGKFEVIKFLELFSEGDFDSFCLAYLFTYRDFEGGTLGLAWTGDLKNAGGVCEKKGHFRGGIKSLNTGIITLLNYGKLVAPAVSHVTLAHEIGHNFGSPHDPDNDKSCTPGGDDGNFIMFARATAGDRRNNNKFSQCSLKSINPVLTVKARDTYGCFQEPQRAICGNGVVEAGEECDCGWEEDCKESCCWPMRRLAWLGQSTGSPCKLKPYSECSPSSGPCCTDKCTFTIGNKCREDNGCRNTAYCDGLRAECPPSQLKPNKTVCDKTSHVCFMGECTGSICLAYGLESCQCSQETFDRSTKLCEVCCRAAGDTKCISSYDWNETPYDLPSVLATPGTPCRNYTGYCDAYSSCREVDPSGPLATLRKLLSADEGLATIAEWVDHHWYVIVGLIAILILLMGLSMRVSRKQRLRKLTVLHSNVEAIQIQRSYLEDSQGGRGTVHPTAIRKKIPFKKKVRERRTKHKNQSGKETQVKSRSLWKSRKPKALVKVTETKPGSVPISSDNTPGPSGTQSSSLPSHTYEVKKVIVPNAKRKGDPPQRRGTLKKDQRKSSKSKSGRHPPPTTCQEGPGEKVRRKSQSSTSPKSVPTSHKKHMQVVYRPPFSVKLEFVPDPHPGPADKAKDPKPSKGSRDVKAKLSPQSVQSQSRSLTTKPRTTLLRKGSIIGGKLKPRKSELQILIPKSQEEDELTTPTQLQFTTP